MSFEKWRIIQTCVDGWEVAIQRSEVSSDSGDDAPYEGNQPQYLEEIGKHMLDISKPFICSVKNGNRGFPTFECGTCDANLKNNVAGAKRENSREACLIRQRHAIGLILGKQILFSICETEH